MIQFNTESPKETRMLGERIARKLRKGDVLALEGELGSGKTTLIQGIVQALGVADRVQSPSFVLVRTYKGALEAKHVDLYRLDPAAVDALHLEEIYNEQGVMLVEWAERASWLPGEVSRIKLSFVSTDSESRLIAITGPLEERLG